MAKAPKVKPGGYEAAGQRVEAAKEVYRIAVDKAGIEFTFAPQNIPVRVRSKIRDTFNRSAEEWLFNRGRVDVDSYADMHWVARLIDGDTVSRDVVQSEWDQHDIAMGDITDELVVNDVDDPKASGQPSS